MRYKTKAFLLCNWDTELLPCRVLKDKAGIVHYYKLGRPYIKDMLLRYFSLQSLFRLDVMEGLVTDKIKKTVFLSLVICLTPDMV